jgi:putative aldouronate transport system substrate-binding protein
MKRHIYGVLIPALAVCALLAGCQQRAAPAAQAAAGSQGRQDPFAKYDPGITLSTTRTMSPNDRFDDTDSDKRSYEENRWNRVFKEDLGVEVKYDWIAPDGESAVAKWTAAIAARSVPDFANVNDNVYKQLYDADLIADMTGIWQDYATDEYIKSLAPTDISMMTLDGKMYGFPGGTRAMAGTSLLFIRQDWLDTLGLKAPETIDEVIEIARKFKDAKLGGSDTIPFMLSNNITGGANFSGSDGKWDGFLNGYGAYLNYWLEKDGKLVYSSIQPEIRPALLKLQELYKEGLINRDFAALTDPVAREYVAAGKTGLFYSAAWMVTQGMNTLVQNNPQNITTPFKMILPVFPPPAVRGQAVKVQTNSPKGYRMFVSNRSSHPEGALKMALLAYQYGHSGKDNYRYYIEGDFNFFKFLPWGDHMTPVDWDLYRGHGIRVAVETGDTSLIDANGWNTTWDSYQEASQGTGSTPSVLMMNGPQGTFTMLYDYYNKGQILIDAYSGLPTDTMALKGDILRGTLETAMFEVVMGADISVWDQAAQKWFTDGGTQITDEVNKWYDGIKN